MMVLLQSVSSLYATYSGGGNKTDQNSGKDRKEQKSFIF